MRTLILLAVLAIAPAARADLVLTRKTHTDAYKSEDGDVAAREGTIVVWVGKDRLRIDDGDRTIVVRLDTKKLHVLDPVLEVASSVDLPLDLVALAPKEYATKLDEIARTLKLATETTAETKRVGSWDAKKSVVTVSGAADAKMTVWATKDLALDRDAYLTMMSHAMSLRPGGARLAEELRKIEGVAVLTERVQVSRGITMTLRDELVSAETKDAPPATYDVPADFKTRPFDPMDEVLRNMPWRPAGAGLPAPAPR